MNLQSINVNTPLELIDPPFPRALPLMNVIPFNVTVAPLAILNTLA